jgi:amylosucrase
MGITYLHLMPLFECPPERNDGGYAVSSFRRVNPEIGTMEELSALSHTLREHGISIVLDFVFNHTSEEHDWAKRALSGDRHYQDFYRMFDTRELPDAYEANLREIFPEQAPGSFTWRPEINKWVWTTFFNFQWDLNYANPDVFTAMLEEMYFLANQGVEILRLDAVPFIWKQLGTNCENLPEAHLLIQAFNALMRIAAPALLFKSEAIVHPRDVQSYIGSEECQVSYNPILMVSLWDSVATRDVRLLTKTMQKRFALPGSTSWINYIRSHDDIGWGFADEDAAEVGINGVDHRYFLNRFFSGRFSGSFARGVPFNYNPRTQDMRISGTTASLMGLEEALERNDELLIEHAIRRLLLCQSIVLSIGGIPLIYLGDELGMLNDYSYAQDPHLAEDSRWIHRPCHDWERAKQRHDQTTVTGRIYQGLNQMIQLRKTLPELRDGDTTFFDSGNTQVLSFGRRNALLILGNFSDHPQTVTPRTFAEFVGNGKLIDLLTSDSLTSVVEMSAWQVRWLKKDA